MPRARRPALAGAAASLALAAALLVAGCDRGIEAMDRTEAVRVTPILYSPGLCRCGHAKHPAKCFSDRGCWCDTFTPDCPECGAQPGNAHRNRRCLR